MLKDVIQVSLLQKEQTQAFIERLIGSMRRRCEAVVAARGGHTRG
jgi:hypothetical protein